MRRFYKTDPQPTTEPLDQRRDAAVSMAIKKVDDSVACLSEADHKQADALLQETLA